MSCFICSSGREAKARLGRGGRHVEATLSWALRVVRAPQRPQPKDGALVAKSAHRQQLRGCSAGTSAPWEGVWGHSGWKCSTTPRFVLLACLVTRGKPKLSYEVKEKGRRFGRLETCYLICPSWLLLDLSVCAFETMWLGDQRDVQK